MLFFRSPKQIVEDAVAEAKRTAADAAKAAPGAAVDALSHIAASEEGRSVESSIQRFRSALPDFVRLSFCAFSGTSAVAAGFLVGIGLDLAALLNKWSIISTVIFYGTIAVSLLSPLLAIPHSIRMGLADKASELRKQHFKAAQAAAQKEEYNKLDRAQLEATIKTRTSELTEMDAASGRIEKARAEKLLAEAELQKHAPTDDRTLLGKLFSADPVKTHADEIVALRAKLESLTEQASQAASDRAKAQTSIATMQDRLTELGENESWTAITKAQSKALQVAAARIELLQAVPFALYLLIAAILLANVVSTMWLFAVAAALLFPLAAALRLGVRYALPWALPVLVFVGYAAGANAYHWEGNVSLPSGEKARIVFAADDRVVVVKHPACQSDAEKRSGCQRVSRCSDTPPVKRKLAILPRSAIDGATIEEPIDTLAWATSLKPLCWLR